MRGVYEKPGGSGIWWIHYYVAGKRHREKVARKSDAIKLYQSPKADATAGLKYQACSRPYKTNSHQNSHQRK